MKDRGQKAPDTCRHFPDLDVAAWERRGHGSGKEDGGLAKLGSHFRSEAYW